MFQGLLKVLDPSLLLFIRSSQETLKHLDPVNVFEEVLQAIFLQASADDVEVNVRPIWESHWSG